MISKSRRVAVAGCGSMGLPMACVLRDAGFAIGGFDIRPSDSFAEFAALVTNDESALARSDILISVVRDERQTMDLCFDKQNVFGRFHYPEILIVCSTLSPRFIRNLATRIPEDVVLVDAPMSGAPVAAKYGRLSFMIGGPDETVTSLLPLFETMGEKIFRAGGVGAGMTLKVLNNYVAAASVVAVRRVCGMAEQLGVDVEQLRAVMQASSGATWYGNQFHDIDWAREGYDPANTIGILEKDVLSALDAVVEIESMPGSALDQSILSALCELKPMKPEEPDQS